MDADSSVASLEFSNSFHDNFISFISRSFRCGLVRPQPWGAVESGGVRGRVSPTVGVG